MSDHEPVTYDHCDHITGPFFHGTKATLAVGDDLVAGHDSNFQPGRRMNHIYFTTIVETAVWGAELSAALAGTGERGHVYIVEPLGTFGDDPNVTDKRFPGNPTRSFRSQHPLRIVGELTDWAGHAPEILAEMLDNVTSLRASGLDVIED